MDKVFGSCRRNAWPVVVFVLLLLERVSWASEVACPEGLPPSCVCGPQILDNQTLWTVECTHTSLSDPSFLRYVPLFADALVLEDITFIADPEPDSFQVASIEQEQPFLKIRYIRLENLSHLINVPLHSLLCSFPNLEIAHLPNNSLRWATLNASCVPHLKVLDLQWNRVHYVLNSTLIELESLPELTLDLSHNRFVCDCNLSPMLRWLQNVSINLVELEQYVCSDGYPEDVSGHRLVELKADQLHCQPDTETFGDPWTRSDPNFGYFLYAVLGFLLVVALAVLAFGFYSNFPKVHQWFRKVEKKPMMQRRRYTTLDTPA